MRTIAKLSGARVPTGALIAPVIPGLSDRPDQIAAVEEACREAGAGLPARYSRTGTAPTCLVLR